MLRYFILRWSFKSLSKLLANISMVNNLVKTAMVYQIETFCRCERCISSPNGEDSGSSNASNARVCSSWLLMSVQSSLFSARCVCAKSSAPATSLLRINSIRCCCYTQNTSIVYTTPHYIVKLHDRARLNMLVLHCDSGSNRFISQYIITNVTVLNYLCDWQARINNFEALKPGIFLHFLEIYVCENINVAVNM